LIDWLVDPFTPVYMQRALLELALLAVPAGALGVFVALRRLAFFTHALGVGAFPGVVVAFGIGVSAFAGGLVSALALALALALLLRRRDIDAPAATGLLLAGALALGSLLVSNVFGSSARVDTLLFGSLLGVRSGDLVRTALVAAAVVAAGIGLRRGFLTVAFDRENAPALGFRPERYDVALFCLLAITIVAAVDAVGTLLVSAVIVVPAATARLFAHRLGPLMAASTVLVLAESVVGLAISYHSGAPPGATVAAVAAGGFAVAYLFRSLIELRARRRLAAAAGTAGLVLLLAACGGSGGSSSSGGGKLQVVATTTQVADWARQIGGSAVEVTQLLEPLVDPHDFEPGPADADAVANAKLVVASGGGLDEWIDGLLESAGGSAKLVRLAPTARLAQSDDPQEGRYDPHFWNDPTLVVSAIRALEHALAEADTDRAAAFGSRARSYISKVRALDRALQREFASVPAARRKMVTDHDAFGYLARRYGLTVVGTAIPSTSTAAEPSAKDTAELIDAIRRERVPVLFSEHSVDPKLVRQLAAATGARVDASLYGDTLGRPGSGAATYLEMMKHNAQRLLEAFRSTPQ
jgi:ABC-type Zn uptake system ZnuABC Zn-binding protein ZnuA/ABC-type Mn2+/Zn2+ transport system permease subunit